MRTPKLLSVTAFKREETTRLVGKTQAIDVRIVGKLTSAGRKLPATCRPFFFQRLLDAGVNTRYTAHVAKARIQPAKVISILNLKGGVGKTHTTWLLAGVCSECRQRCLCVDLDTQGNLTRNLLGNQSPTPGIEDVFHPGNDADLQSLIRKSPVKFVDLVPASAALSPFDLANQPDWEAGDLQRSLVDALAPVRNDYEYILLDCPPRLSLVSFAALVASDHVMIPLEAADWGAQGVTQVTEAVHYVRKRENRQLHLLGYLISRFKTARSYQHSYFASLREHFGDLAFDTVVPDLAGFEKSVTHCLPVTLRQPASREADIARRLFDEVRQRIGQDPIGRAATRCRNVSTPCDVAL